MCVCVWTFIWCGLNRLRPFIHVRSFLGDLCLNVVPSHIRLLNDNNTFRSDSTCWKLKRLQILNSTKFILNMINVLSIVNFYLGKYSFGLDTFSMHFSYYCVSKIFFFLFARYILNALLILLCIKGIFFPLFKDFCTPMDPHIWLGKSKTTSTNIHSAAMWGYGM